MKHQLTNPTQHQVTGLGESINRADDGSHSQNGSLTRRALFGRAANAAATLMVSQSLLGCEATDITSDEEEIFTSTAGCVLTAALTEGPYFVDERLNRSDIRSDPVTGDASEGVPLELTFNVSRVGSTGCTPLTGAYLDVWHCDATGIYSDVAGAGSGRRFLRGYQITDASGVAQFTTIYPGWYSGRAVHVHFKLRIIAGSSTTYEFTSQFFFNEWPTTAVHAQNPYNTRGTRNTLNTSDGIYNSLSAAEKAALTLQTTEVADGYRGVVGLGVQLG
jgi:protocatechuate 3,4-dioxygenase beta subunit